MEKIIHNIIHSEEVYSITISDKISPSAFKKIVTILLEEEESWDAIPVINDPLQAPVNINDAPKDDASP
tara:strand:+ start:5692 stop:5898 length:207 start_codon:yes stop_codon:yes gene_type:complete